MPFYGYHQYQDSETGQISLIPNLTANCIDMMPGELEAWVSKGIVPKDLYDDQMKAMQKSQERNKEIYNRVQAGEPLETIVLSNPFNLSELNKTLGLTEYLLKNKGRLYGEDILLKTFSKLSDNDPEIVWLAFVREAMSNIVSTDPLPIHFAAARKILKEKYNIEDSRAVDILTRDLLDHCQKIADFKAFKHPAFNKNPIDSTDLNDNLAHENKHILQIDAEFITHLKKIGKKGIELAAKVEKNCTDLFTEHATANYSQLHRRNVWSLWVTIENPISAVLSLLSQALWEDRCSRLWDRDTNGSPAIAKSIIERIIPILKPKKSKDSFIEKDENIFFCGVDGEPLLSAPAVDINMISAFKKGVKELGTLTGHKMLRWQVNTGFERWSKGESDPRLIEIDGGYSGIAHAIGCCNPREIAKIKDILHAQAHGYFRFADGTQGNMIILNVLKRHQNQEPSKIRIILGDMLLPNYVCQLQRSEKRLIPIGDLPSLKGASPDTYAGQAQLQLFVFCEFSNQSVRLAKEGSVLLSTEWWKEKAVEAGLNPEKIGDIISHWCQPDLFKSFLDKQGDEYRLTTHYERQQRFLEYQGNVRIKRSEMGRKSIEKQGKKKFK